MEIKHTACKSERVQSSRPLVSARACLPGCFVVWARCCVSWGAQKYTNPTEGAFLAGLGPPTHGSLFKPPPILYSSVRGGLLTLPNSTQQNLDLDPTEEGGHAHMHTRAATRQLQTWKRTRVPDLFGGYTPNWSDVTQIRLCRTWLSGTWKHRIWF